MLRIGNLNENKVLTITAGGKLTKEDYQQLLPELENLLEQHGTLHFFIQLENFTGFEPGALLQDVQFDFKHKDRFGKTAIVGDKKWEEWGTKISGLFFNFEMRFYYNDQKKEAWKWVNA